MSVDTFTALVEDLTAERQCVVCAEYYTEVTSWGRNECRRHLGMLQSVDPLSYLGETDTYTCCGVSPYGWHRRYQGADAARGCVRCDHMDHIALAEAHSGLPLDTTMPYDRARILFSEDIDERNVRKEANGTITIIRSTRRL